MRIRTLMGRIPFVITIYDYFKHIKASKQIKSIVMNEQQLNLVLGAASYSYNGWISTNKGTLDILNAKTWEKLIPRNYVSHLLAEHVWEHLTEEQGLKALEICLKYLKKNGTLRIAVPDAYHPSKYYIDYVKPGGIGPGADDHKVFYDYISMAKLLSHFIDFIEFNFLEYYDETGILHKKPINIEYGLIKRMVENNIPLPDCEKFYSSLIVDIKLIKEF